MTTDTHGGFIFAEMADQKQIEENTRQMLDLAKSLQGPNPVPGPSNCGPPGVSGPPGNSVPLISRDPSSAQGLTCATNSANGVIQGAAAATLPVQSGQRYMAVNQNMPGNAGYLNFNVANPNPQWMSRFTQPNSFMVPGNYLPNNPFLITNGQWSNQALHPPLPVASVTGPSLMVPHTIVADPVQGPSPAANSDPAPARSARSKPKKSSSRARRYDGPPSKRKRSWEESFTEEDEEDGLSFDQSYSMSSEAESEEGNESPPPPPEIDSNRSKLYLRSLFSDAVDVNYKLELCKFLCYQDQLIALSRPLHPDIKKRLEDLVGEREEGEDIDVVESCYRQKCEKVFEIIGKSMRNEDQDASSIYDKDYNVISKKVHFPPNPELEKLFKYGWRGLTGTEDENLEGSSNPDTCTPPQNPAKWGKRPAPKKAVAMSQYSFDYKSGPFFPLDKPKVDADINASLHCRVKEQKSDLDDFIGELGKSLKVLNMELFFAEATHKLLDKDKWEDMDIPELKKMLKLLKEINDSRGRAMMDMTKLMTNLQLNMWVAKREEVLKQLRFLRESEKSLLRFLDPKDSQQRLFSGLLGVCGKNLDKRGKSAAVSKVLNDFSNHKAYGSSRKYRRSGKRAESKSSNTERSFRGSRSHDSNREKHDKNTYKQHPKYQEKKKSFSHKKDKKSGPRGGR